MALFDYRARDQAGVEQAGQLEADSLQAARVALQSRGWEVLTLGAADAEITLDMPARLSARDSEQVLQAITEISAAQLPLSDGLRAAADECDSWEGASVLTSIARRLEQGEPLERVMEESDDVFSGHIRKLIAVAHRTGDLGHTLCELDEHHRAVRELRSTILLAFSYPILVTCLAIGILFCLIVFITPPFERMTEEFGMELPQITRLIFWWRESGLLVLGAALLATTAATLVARAALGPAGWLRLLQTVPLFGVLFQWSALAEWASVLSILIRSQVPIPEALRLAADAVRSPYMGELSKQLADQAKGGSLIADAVAANPQFPRSLEPIVRWGEETGMLGEAFATIQAVFLHRMRDRALLLRSICSPFIFIAIGCGLQFVIGGLLLPLVDLIQGLA